VRFATVKVQSSVEIPLRCEKASELVSVQPEITRLPTALTKITQETLIILSRFALFVIRRSAFIGSDAHDSSDKSVAYAAEHHLQLTSEDLKSRALASSATQTFLTFRIS
jgi:hypothetical protein